MDIDIVDNIGKRLAADKVNFPPKGNFTIPERTDYVTFTPRVDVPELVATIKRQVDWARMCLDHGRPDLADNTLRGIWSLANAIEKK